MTSRKLYKFLPISLASIYIIFGFLKLFNISPVEYIVDDFPLMDNETLFRLFGACEVLVGVLLLTPMLRKWGALLSSLHLISTFATLIFSTDLIFNSNTLVTVEGEFVYKNVTLIAVALYVYFVEKEKK